MEKDKPIKKESQEQPEGISNEEKIRIDILAEKIKLLFGFCANLISDIDLLEKAEKTASDKSDYAISAAPLFGLPGWIMKKWPSIGN